MLCYLRSQHNSCGKRSSLIFIFGCLAEVHGGRESLRILQPRFEIETMPLMIFVNKGIEIESNALTLEIITDTCGPEIAQAATFIVSFTLSTW